MENSVLKKKDAARIILPAACSAKKASQKCMQAEKIKPRQL
jgi:hypothetical protein